MVILDSSRHTEYSVRSTHRENPFLPTFSFFNGCPLGPCPVLFVPGAAQGPVPIEIHTLDQVQLSVSLLLSVSLALSC